MNEMLRSSLRRFCTSVRVNRVARLLSRIGVFRHPLRRIQQFAFPEAVSPLSRVGGEEAIQCKHEHELNYWRRAKRTDGLSGDHYKDFYTKQFKLTTEFYRGKRVLDIGCGPRGSLEWAEMAAERVGLDPLAPEYLKLAARYHKMTYVAAASEAVPYGSGHFDVVCSFNSLDHVDDLDGAISEIVRVTKPGGVFLLLTEVGHEPTVCEPQEISWDVVRKFSPAFRLVEEIHYEKKAGGMYASILESLPYDHNDKTSRYGILSAKFERVAGAPTDSPEEAS